MKNTRWSILMLLFFFLSTAISEAQKKEQVHWLDFQQLSDSLQINPSKKVLIFFHTDWCVYCRKMEQEVFTDSQVAEVINRDYYAVRFDAESTDTVHFDGQTFINREHKSRRKGFHEIARLLAGRGKQLSVPVTLVLDGDFHVKARYFEFLSRKKILLALL